uniref:Uncharacterized protein n=1 Tax=Strombidium inclinatum TaxID=197538 RepID=A0A7S3IRK8_9SPIT|mmetsp:Transcript_33118/g.50774  ORF Transcript_33118/g.50774 Transcript_33118/m.50774 type:complete len:133 (+) Transcript_33118:348-746(+)
MLIFARLSHTGEVCSGDYSKFIVVPEDDKYVVDSEYDKYLLTGEGHFMYVYALFCLISVGALLFCCTCIGSCLCLTGSYESFSEIEDTFKNMDSIDEMFKKQQEKAYKEYAEQYGGGFPGGPQEEGQEQQNP